MSAKRITESMIKERIARINESLGFNPSECESSYIKGSYRLDSAYGGHRMVKVLSAGGCIIPPFGMSGFYTKRELWNKIVCFTPEKES